MTSSVAAAFPLSGVGAVALNVTVTEPTAASFLTVWPTGRGAAAGIEPELHRRTDRGQLGAHQGRCRRHDLDLQQLRVPHTS